MKNLFGSACLAVLVLATSSLALACSGAPEESSADDSSEEIASKSARFETFVGQDGQHYFTLIAGNGQDVIRSEGYTTSESAKKGIASVQANGTDTANFEILEANDGEYYVNLRAQNHEIIGTTELYSSKSNATRAASTIRALVKLLAPSPSVGDAAKVQRFEVFTGEDAKYYFRLRANNGEIVLASQGYTSKESALGGIKSVETNGTDSGNYDLVDANDGQVGFDLKAANGQVIARSETYVSASNADRAIQTCVSLTAQQLPTVSK
ncbi:MAG: YegP family protein [Polyangiaceae bacterium]